MPTKTEVTNIEVLIGNDYYLDLILPKKTPVNAGLYLLNCYQVGMDTKWSNQWKLESNHPNSTLLPLANGSNIYATLVIPGSNEEILFQTFTKREGLKIYGLIFNFTPLTLKAKLFH